MQCTNRLWLTLRPGLQKMGNESAAILGATAWRTFIHRHLTVLLAIGLLLVASCQPTLAAERTGNDPTTALFPTDSWVALADGQHHWYAFRDEGDGTAITIRLTVLPTEGAIFTVFTAEQAKQWTLDQTVAAVGAGTPLALFRNDLYWTGNFVQSGTYYVLVTSQDRGPSNYKLTISGQGISFPRLSFAQPISPLVGPQPPLPPSMPPSMPPTLPTPSPTMTAPAAPSGPDNPLPPIGKATAIGVDEVHWYAFRDEGDEASIQVRADATPADCLAFQVWTPEELRLWQLGEEFRPVGQGTANLTLNADLFWTGSFIKAATYYVVVERNPTVTKACSYQLTVLGDNVSLLPLNP